MNRLGGEIDAVLSLLDRQVIDSEGLMVCKVDDLELHADDEGALRVAAILAGAPALLPRFSGHLGETLLDLWERLGIEQSRRRTPWRIDIDLVDELNSAVHLRIEREHLLRKPATPEGNGAAYIHRLDHLLGMTVHHGDIALGKVLDVRLAAGPDAALVCSHLLVGRGRSGAMLGYDRSVDMGPAVLRRTIRWLHRHSGQVPFSSVTDLDWERRTIRVDTDLTELSHA